MLSVVAGSVMTVVSIVFSLTVTTLAQTSSHYGPRVLRNFTSDRFVQFTLGTFVATFVYAVLVLGSIGVGSHGEFVPHVGVTVTLGLMVADLAVLIYFIHHTAVSIQLPQVIASIAADLTARVNGGATTIAAVNTVGCDSTTPGATSTTTSSSSTTRTD